MADILIVAASPHAAGTTMALAQLAAGQLAGQCTVQCTGAPDGQSARRPGGQHAVTLLSLAGRALTGCTHCGYCRKPPHTCVLQAQDACEDIFCAMQAASLVLWLSPVYFYGLPALAKALIDRSQRMYEALEAGISPGRAGIVRTAAQPLALSLLFSGRTKGQWLFTGSHLALKYFFPCLGIRYAGSLALRGLESPADISQDVRDTVTLAVSRLGEMAASPGRPGSGSRGNPDDLLQQLLAACPLLEDAAGFCTTP